MAFVGGSIREVGSVTIPRLGMACLFARDMVRVRDPRHRRSCNEAETDVVEHGLVTEGSLSYHQVGDTIYPFYFLVLRTAGQAAILFPDTEPKA